MRQAGVEANTITYNSLITACANGKHTSDALRVFEQMRQAGVEANTISYSALITACANGKQTSDALGVFELMREAGVEADMFSYNALITALSRDTPFSFSRCRDLLSTMCAQGLEPDAFSFCPVLLRVAQLRNPEMLRAAVALFDSDIPLEHRNEFVYRLMIEVFFPPW